jgi:putative ABC transport system substrate-binding protein
MMTGSDLVDAGLASSHRRPGGNVTGVADNSDEILIKRFEYARELLPAAARFVLLVNPDFPATPKMERRMAEASKRAGVGLRVLSARDASALDTAVASLGPKGADVILVGGDALFVVSTQAMIDKATALGMPVVHYWPDAPEFGAVLTYTVDVVDNYRRAAWYVDRILKGARPGDLPIHQPTRYELAVNVRAARGMGIQVPQALRARADHVVE